jgi:hypothetical protein
MRDEERNPREATVLKVHVSSSKQYAHTTLAQCDKLVLITLNLETHIES